MNIAEKMYRVMERKCLKQCLVAKAAGFTAKAFNDMLRGRKVIKSEDLPRICDALGITPNDLFEEEDG